MNGIEAVKIVQGLGQRYTENDKEYQEAVAVIERDITKLSAIKQVVENWDEHAYYTDSFRSMKKIEDIIKGGEMRKIQKIHCILADKYVRNVDITNKDYRMIDEFIGNAYTTLTDCISLLSVSGENTKAIVMGKLKGLVE